MDSFFKPPRNETPGGFSINDFAYIAKPSGTLITKQILLQLNKAKNYCLSFHHYRYYFHYYRYSSNTPYPLSFIFVGKIKLIF